MTVIALTWILGAVVGAVLWAAFLRLPVPLARWLCEPFGASGRITMALSMLVAVLFLLTTAIGGLLGLSVLINAGAGTAPSIDPGTVRRIIFVSSILGYLFIPIIGRLEKIAAARWKNRKKLRPPHK